MGRLRELGVLIPPIVAQQEFAERVEQIRSIRFHQFAATAKAEAAFNALLAQFLLIYILPSNLYNSIIDMNVENGHNLMEANDGG